MTSLSLSDLPLHAPAIVQTVRTTRTLAVRLMELGLVEGTRVVVRRKAPLGDPIEIELRGYALSLRGEEAKLVVVEREAPASAEARR